MSAASFPRRQQAYRLKRAAIAGAGAVVIAAAGVVAGLAGLTALAVVLLLTAGPVGLYARHWMRLASRSQVGTLGGRGAAGTRNARARGLAAAPLNRLASRWGHRPRRDRTDRRRVRDRDQDTHLPPQPPHQGQRAGSLAAPSSPPLVPTRRATSPVRHTRTRRADPTRRPRGLCRSPRGSAACRGRRQYSAEVPHR
jgi:hypothetical protein